MKWSYVRFKAVCRRPLTRRNIDALQAERVEAGKDPLTLKELDTLVYEFVANPQSHHYGRARFLLMKKG
jgi:hypothetical protein